MIAPTVAARPRRCRQETDEAADPIIEHVEDPQRRQSSPTYVWLDMIVRHASELFGFYVCRFVLSDVTMLAEKFCKRASEWSQA